MYRRIEARWVLKALPRLNERRPAARRYHRKHSGLFTIDGVAGA